jgi:hypothetical protein
MMTNGRGFSKPALYEIRVEGSLESEWSDWFDGLEITQRGEDETVLTGVIADQPALHGVLAKVRDLGLPLLAVRRVPDRA